MKERVLFLLISMKFIYQVISLPLPFDQYSYILARNKLTHRNRSINFKEKTVNLYMKSLKHQEFHHFYPSRPIEDELENIKSSRIYSFLRNFPKGGNLHIHELQMLDRRKFLEIVLKQEPESDWFYICDKQNHAACQSNSSVCECLDYHMRYYAKNPDKGWVKVKNSNWTVDKIIEKTTLIGILNKLDKKVYPTDSNGRWKIANELGVFNFYSDLTKYNKTRFEYMKAALDSSLDENVQLVEFRCTSFGLLFYYDSELNKISIPINEEFEMLRKFKHEYIKQNPNFIDYIFIMNGFRKKNKEEIQMFAANNMKLQSQYPEIIRGFDLVGEEDQGHTLLFHSDALIDTFKYSQNSNGTYNLILHTAETNWPEDLIPENPEDGVSTLDNIYDSILLRSIRIGHGIGLIKQPELYKYLIKRGIAIEVCPASNQILGYVSDVRNHPAINYFRSEIPIVLAGDDPGSFGFDELTVDYYLAFMSWGLDLYDLKKIANNSIRYSVIPNEIKNVGYEKFNKEWEDFVNETYEKICTKQKKFADLKITNLMPSFGPVDREVEITLFGHAFEIGLCEKLFCIFDKVKKSAELIELDEIRCKTPKDFTKNPLETVYVRIQIGDLIYSTGFNYTFLSSFGPIVDDGLDRKKRHL